jgi:hypothetical protein
MEENKEMSEIISNLRKKMNEIDEITKKISEKNKENKKDSPEKTKKLLEEISVPALDLLK